MDRKGDKRVWAMGMDRIRKAKDINTRGHCGDLSDILVQAHDLQVERLSGGCVGAFLMRAAGKRGPFLFLIPAAEKCIKS